MARGADLFVTLPPRWEDGLAFLLLNPRLPAAMRTRILSADFPDAPGRVWLATSGTGGVTKTVALSRAALEASARAVNTRLDAGPRDVWLNPLPLFHAGGLGIVVRAALSGARREDAGAWSAETFLRLLGETGATLTSLVPAQVHDLARSGARPPSGLRAAVVGGGALDEPLRAMMADRGWPLLPSYGLTEAASQVATALPGQADFAWLPLLPHFEARTAPDGILELRGPALLDGWMVFPADGAPEWEDPKRDGWLRTGDRAGLRGRELRVLGRADDLVKIRGELVDLAALERSLQARVRAGKVVLHAQLDERNGTALHVVAENAAAVREADAAADEIFPRYARPAQIVHGTIETTALGKTVRRRVLP
jgi:O-succinylbenzoic acid--CoA ligase